MRKRTYELWYALAAMIGITIVYVLIAAQGIPKASSLFGHGIGILGFLFMLSTETLYSLRKRARGKAHRADEHVAADPYLHRPGRLVHGAAALGVEVQRAGRRADVDDGHHRQPAVSSAGIFTRRCRALSMGPT